MKKLFLFFSAIITLLSSIAQAQNVQFKRFTLDQGLSMNFINSICQDQQGFVWVGTSDGLNKYDGYKFTVYRNDPKIARSLTNSSITTLYIDKKGTLYVGTNNGGLNIYDRKKDSFIAFQNDPKNPKSIGSNRITAILEDSQGVLWVGTEAGLHIFDHDSQTFTPYLHHPKNHQSVISDVIRALAEDRHGNLWIGTEEGTSVLDKNRKVFTHYWHEEGNPTSISTNPVRSIFVDHEGKVWIGTAFGGLNLFDEKSKSFTSYRQDQSQANYILGDYVPGICEDQQGHIWVATNFGISVWDKKTGSFTHYQNDAYNSNSLVDNGLNTVFSDLMGNIWVGSIAGLSMKEVLPPQFQHFVKNPGNSQSLGSKEVFSFYQDSKDHIWIGLRAGFDLFNRSSNTFKHYQSFPDGKIIPTITAIYEDKKGGFWLGMYEGLARYNWDKGTYEMFTVCDPKNPASVPIRDVWYVQEDIEGNLWIASFTKGIFRYHRDENRFQALEWSGKYIPTVGINTFYADPAGNLWIGTSLEGLFKLNQEKGIYQVYKHDPGNHKSISDNYILTIYDDHKGNFWIGTKGGLNRMNQHAHTFTNYRKSDGLPNNFINGIQVDKKGTLWLSTNKGLSNFNPTAKTFKNYNIDDGLQHNEFWHRSTYKLRSGELLFGGINGFNLFSPDKIRGNTYTPQVYITDFQIFNKPVALGEAGSPLQSHISETKTLTLSYKQSVFSFEFVALNYIVSKNNQYAYQLEGFDKDWNYIGTQRKATYTNLDPGEYVFRVKASNNDGVWNQQGTSLKLIITPPFWQTWWFRSLVAITIVGSAFTFYRVRINAIKAQKEALENQVMERTAEVVQQKEELQTQAENLKVVVEELQETQEELLQQQEEIEVQRDNLQKVNEHVMSSIQYAKTIQKAILPSRKSIEQVFPDHFVLYRPKDVVSGDFYWYAHLAKEEVEGLDSNLTFLATIDCTGHGVPGAFMSIIGHTLLNEIVNQKHILDPALILEELDKGIRKAVDQSEEINTAGMDVCLIRLQQGEGHQLQLLFSGAKRPLYYVLPEDPQVHSLIADRRSIGSQSKVERAFTTQSLQLEPGTCLYLTTDGYADQNNLHREKLGTQKLKELIGQEFGQPLQHQQLLFETTLDLHQQYTEQRDDITLIGVRL